MLNLPRVEELQRLLKSITTPEAHTELLKTAHRYNDAEAIHVLLRANLFVVNELDFFSVHKIPCYTVLL